MPNPCEELEQSRDRIRSAYEAALRAEQDSIPPTSAAPLGPLPPQSITFGKQGGQDRKKRIDRAREDKERLFADLEAIERKLLACYEENNVPVDQRFPSRKRP